MEVAGQWRREWAGTAEYGKVTEGGVTRQVARAMEVLHASAPGARVRVLRAAYHSTAGPGAPASSYMLHSSRRVISSGYNFIEPETPRLKPLEISSTPLESSPELEVGNENYKVTEPDDFDISEPSKWRGSKSINSIRMPSEESSSTDNASIIDLDYNHKNSARKTPEFSTQSYHKRLSPISSLLDTPVTLSTLKYKSLLNGNDSWNNRRKSYSFEDTPELDEVTLRESDALTMESSTDSGICKSTEIVNSDSHNLESTRFIERKNKMEDIHEESFKDWLSKNRKTQYINQVQSKKEHIIGIELKDDSNITLQSKGKMSITLPTSTKPDDSYEMKNGRSSDDYDRRTKKVEFCKTELHFAAESGTVNIIATDEKPPPSNDFRKKRSMFVPMTNNYDKPITLFGEKNDVFKVNTKSSSGVKIEINTIDENTAATKGILKNKIPKPKPYLLGENMVLGESIDLHSDTVKDDTNDNYAKPTGVSLINRQLEIERKFSNESKLSVGNESDWSSFKNPIRTTNTGPADFKRSNQEIEKRLLRNSEKDKDVSETIKTKVKILQMSPIQPRAKTRQLRESDLTYFGVAKTGETQNEKRKHSLDSIFDENNIREETLQSVQLVKLISNSVCNSEVDSDEAPDYENVPIKNNFNLKSASRSRSKYRNHMDESKEQKDLNPIFEKDDEILVVEPRRIKVKRHAATPTNRSLSEPRKATRQKSIEAPNTVVNKIIQIKHSSSKSNSDTMEKGQKSKISEGKLPDRKISESPVYVNLGTKDTKKTSVEDDHSRSKQRSIQRQKAEKKTKDDPCHAQHTKTKRNIDNVNDATKQLSYRVNSEKQKEQDLISDKKKASVHRTKVLVTPEKSPGNYRETSPTKHRSEKNSIRDKKGINQPNQKSSTKIETQESKHLHSDRNSKDLIASPMKTDVKSLQIPKNCNKLSTDNTSTHNSSKGTQELHSNVIVPDMQPKAYRTEKIDKTDNKSRRSKYVINYDDKNGTVSSICKIRPEHGSTRKRRPVNYDNTDNIKGRSVNKNDSPNKNNPLQIPDQQRILYGNSKVKSKIHTRQSCQIL